MARTEETQVRYCGVVRVKCGCVRSSGPEREGSCTPVVIADCSWSRLGSRCSRCSRCGSSVGEVGGTGGGRSGR